MDKIDLAMLLAIDNKKSYKLVSKPQMVLGEEIWPEDNETVLAEEDALRDNEVVIARIEHYIHPVNEASSARVRFTRLNHDTILLLG